MQLLLDSLGAVLRKPFRTMRATYVLVVLTVCGLWVYYLADLWSATSLYGRSSGVTLVDLDHLGSDSEDGTTGVQQESYRAHATAVARGSAQESAGSSSAVASFSGRGAAQPEGDDAVLPVEPYRSDRHRGDFVTDSLSLGEKMFAFYGDNFVFSAKTYDGAQVRGAAYIYVSSALLDQRLDLLSRGMPILANKQSACTPNSDHGRRPGWYFGLLSQARGKVVRMPPGAPPSRRRRLTASSAGGGGGAASDRMASMDEKAGPPGGEGEAGEPQYLVKRTQAPPAAASADGRGADASGSGGQGNLRGGGRTAGAKPFDPKHWPLAEQRVREAERLRARHGLKDVRKPTDGAGTGTSSSSGAAVVSDDQQPSGSGLGSANTAALGGPPQVRLFLNWSSKRIACNELVSSFALPLDQWVRVGFKMDEHVAIFIENEVVADTATADRGTMQLGTALKVKMKNGATLLKEMATRRMGRGTYIGGARQGTSFFLGFIADVALWVYDQEVVHLRNGDLTNTASAPTPSSTNRGAELKNSYPEKFEVAHPTQFTRSGPARPGSPENTVLEPHLLDRYVGVPLPGGGSMLGYVTDPAGAAGAVPQHQSPSSPSVGDHATLAPPLTMPTLIAKVMSDIAQKSAKQAKTEVIHTKKPLPKSMESIREDHEAFEKAYAGLAKNHDGTLSFNRKFTTTVAPLMDNYFEGSKQRAPLNVRDIKTFAPAGSRERENPFDVLPRAGVKDELESEDLLSGAKKMTGGGPSISGNAPSSSEGGAAGGIKAIGKPGGKNAADKTTYEYDHEMHEEILGEISQHLGGLRPIDRGKKAAALAKRAGDHRYPHEKAAAGAAKLGESSPDEYLIPGEETVAPIEKLRGVTTDPKRKSYFDLGEQEKMRLREKGVPEEMLNPVKAPILDVTPDVWAAEVRAEMQFVWSAYKAKTFGNDEISPVTGFPHNWVGLGVMICESLDTLFLMGLKNEFKEGLQWLSDTSLAAEAKDAFVSTFEVNIRVVGGLLGAYSLSGENVLLEKAREVADLLLDSNVFAKMDAGSSGGSNLLQQSGRIHRNAKGKSPLILPEVNLKTRKARHHEWTGYYVLSEVGTYQLEWRYLSYALKDPKYQEFADRQQQFLLDKVPRQVRGLLPNFVDPSGTVVSQDYSFGSGGDSWYEYLLKSHLWMHNVFRETCAGVGAGGSPGDVDGDGRGATPIPAAVQDQFCAALRDTGRKREKGRDPAGDDEIRRALAEAAEPEDTVAAATTASTATTRSPALVAAAEESIEAAGTTLAADQKQRSAKTPGAAAAASPSSTAIPTAAAGPLPASSSTKSSALSPTAPSPAQPAPAPAASGAATGTKLGYDAGGAMVSKVDAPEVASSFADLGGKDASTTVPPSASSVPPTEAASKSSSTLPSVAPLAQPPHVEHADRVEEEEEAPLPPGTETNPPLGRDKAPETYPPELLAGSRSAAKAHAHPKTDSLAARIVDKTLSKSAAGAGVAPSGPASAISSANAAPGAGPNTADLLGSDARSPHQMDPSNAESLKKTVAEELDSTKKGLREWRTAMYSLSQRMLVQGFPPHDGDVFLREAKMGNLINRMEHLSCFVPGMLILGYHELPISQRDDAWLETADSLMETCVSMYKRNFFGLACEATRFRLKRDIDEKKLMHCDGDDKVYHLRPEVVESLFYMWYYTGDTRFQRYGYEIFRAIKIHAKSKYGYSSVAWQFPEKNHPRAGHLFFKPRLLDKQESYFPAETLKYLFLLFQGHGAATAQRSSSAGTAGAGRGPLLSLENFVFNTEGHPIARFKPQL